MSGVFSLSQQFYFAYLAANGRPVSPGATLQVVGHLSLAALILSTGFLLWNLSRNISVVAKRPIYVARQRILEAKEKAERMKNAIQRKWMPTRSSQVDALRREFIDLLETYMPPDERSELLGRRADYAEAVADRMQLIMDNVPEKKVDLFQNLNDLLIQLDVALQRIERMKEF